GAALDAAEDHFYTSKRELRSLTKRIRDAGDYVLDDVKIIYKSAKREYAATKVDLGAANRSYDKAYERNEKARVSLEEERQAQAQAVARNIAQVARVHNYARVLSAFEFETQADDSLAQPLFQPVEPLWTYRNTDPCMHRVQANGPNLAFSFDASFLVDVCRLQAAYLETPGCSRHDVVVVGDVS
ncbi:hypothetical protein GGI21_002909, partial [Coemansia aciculifera]